MPNALHQLTAYRKDGLWMFDDPRKNIFEEPFVAGADIMFDLMSGRNRDAHADGFDGHFYTVRKFLPELERFQFWLCPALLAFFEKAPQSIFVKVIQSASV